MKLSRFECQKLLKKFDLDGRWGPCVGISRLARWERAKKLGKNPPMVIGKILSSDLAKNQSSIWEGRV